MVEGAHHRLSLSRLCAFCIVQRQWWVQAQVHRLFVVQDDVETLKRFSKTQEKQRNEVWGKMHHVQQRITAVLKACFEDAMDAHMLFRQIDGFYDLTFMEKARPLAGHRPVHALPNLWTRCPRARLVLWR